MILVFFWQPFTMKVHALSFFGPDIKEYHAWFFHVLMIGSNH